MRKRDRIIVTFSTIAILCAIGHCTVSNMSYEVKLKKEIGEIQNLLGNKDSNKDDLNEKLSETITRHKYKIIEEAAKSYLSDRYNNKKEITDISNSDRLNNMLTIENYKNDGQDFITTKKFIADSKEKLNECNEKNKKFYEEETIMSYIKEKKLSKYYISLYKSQISEETGDIKIDNKVEEDVNATIKKLDDYEKVIDFLIRNKGTWMIRNDNLLFENASLTNQYNKLIKDV